MSLAIQLFADLLLPRSGDDPESFRLEAKVVPQDSRVAVGRLGHMMNRGNKPAERVTG